MAIMPLYKENALQLIINMGAGFWLVSYLESHTHPYSFISTKEASYLISFFQLVL